MKHLKIVVVVYLIASLLCSCSNGGNSSETGFYGSSEQTSEVGDSAAVIALYYYFGTSDTETGRAYSFSITDTISIDGVDYYHGRWSSLSSGEDGTVINSSLLYEFFLKKDLTLFYKGTYNYTDSKADFDGEAIDISKK